MELRHMRYFVAVAEERNFTRAAVRVGIGQPPLSQQIRDLEDELGVLLFRRLRYGVELTDAGSAFLAEVRVVLAEAEKAKILARRAHRGEIGSLALGVSGSAAFNPVVSSTIRDFRVTWPHVLLSLQETNSTRLLELLAIGDIDAAFIRPGLKDPDGFSLSRLPDELMLIALPAGHNLAGHAQLPLAALAEEPIILFPRAVAVSLYDEIVSTCRVAGFEPVTRQQAPQMVSVINMVAAELGVSIVPAALAQIKFQGVVYRSIEGLAPVARLALAFPRGEPAPTTKNLLSFLSR